MFNWAFLLVFTLACHGESSNMMTFQGKAYFKCPRFDTGETLTCFSMFTSSVFHSDHRTAEKTCSFPNLVANFTEDLVKPNCSLLWMQPIPAIANVSSFLPPQSFKGPPQCIGGMETELDTNCNVMLSDEDFDFLRMCGAFGVKNAFRTCTCDMFHIVHRGYKQSLCTIFNETKSYRMKPPVLLKKEEINQNYQTILKRSCMYTGSQDNCGCSDHQILMGNSSGDFCQKRKIMNITEICIFFNISMDECHCSLFNFKNSTDKSLICDYLKPKRILKHLTSYILPYAIVETVASIIGIFGNLFVILIAFRFRRGLATCKKLIAHLALYDLIFAVTQLIYAVPKFWTSKFIYGEAVCKILISSDSLGASLAMVVILIISIERFIGIVNPFRGGLSTKSLQAILGINICFCLGFTAPLFYYNQINQVGMCDTKWPEKVYGIAYYVTFSVVFLCIPVGLIAILYTVIITTLRGAILVGNSDFIADPRIRQKRIQDNKRTMCVLSSVVIVFVLFVFPKYIVLVYLSLKGDIVGLDDMQVGEYFGLMYIIHFTYPFHVAINPVIYSIIDKRWRNDARLYFTRSSTRKRSAYSATMTSTLTNRRRSSAATVLDDQASRRRTTQINNNNNNAKQLIVTTNGGGSFDLSPIPTPVCQTPLGIGFENGVAWRGECKSTGSSCTFVQ